MKLFSVGKVGVTLDHIVHKLEKRKDGDVKVLELKCRVQPLSTQIALAIDEVVKGAGGYVLTFSATFSQDDKQLSYAEGWRTEMRFITTEEAEPSLEFADPEPAEDEDDETPERPAPMFEDPRDETKELVGVGAGPEKARRIPKRNGKK